jgi:hypothetical protein
MFLIANLKKPTIWKIKIILVSSINSLIIHIGPLFAKLCPTVLHQIKLDYRIIFKGVFLWYQKIQYTPYFLYLDRLQFGFSKKHVC